MSVLIIYVKRDMIEGRNMFMEYGQSYMPYNKKKLSKSGQRLLFEYLITERYLMNGLQYKS